MQPAPVKTFQRRAKKDLPAPASGGSERKAAAEVQPVDRPDVLQMHDTSLGSRGQKSPSPGIQPEQAKTPTCPSRADSADEPGSAPDDQTDSGYGWLNLGRARRSSLLMGNLQAGQGFWSLLQKQVAPGKKISSKEEQRRRERDLRDILGELVDYFAEVDAEELIVEEASPEAKPKSKGRSNRKAIAAAAAGKAVAAPTGASADLRTGTCVGAKSARASAAHVPGTPAQPTPVGSSGSLPCGPSPAFSFESNTPCTPAAGAGSTALPVHSTGPGQQQLPDASTASRAASVSRSEMLASPELSVGFSTGTTPSDCYTGDTPSDAGAGMVAAAGMRSTRASSIMPGAAGQAHLAAELAVLGRRSSILVLPSQPAQPQQQVGVGAADKRGSLAGPRASFAPRPSIAATLPLLQSDQPGSQADEAGEAAAVDQQAQAQLPRRSSMLRRQTLARPMEQGAAAGAAPRSHNQSLAGTPCYVEAGEDEGAAGQKVAARRDSTAVGTIDAGAPTELFAGGAFGSSGPEQGSGAEQEVEQPQDALAQHFSHKLSLAPGFLEPLREEEAEEEGEDHGGIEQARASLAQAAIQEEEEEEEASAEAAGEKGRREEEAEGGAYSEDDVAGAGRDQEPAAPARQLTPLQQLLEICGQSVEEADIPSMDALVSSQAELKKMVKIGEGTYGEAFKFNKMVFKIVPIEGSELVNGAPQKKAHEMAAEALIALTLTHLRTGRVPGSSDTGAAPNLTSCFVETFKVGVCHGPYSKDLVKAWRKWDKAHGSENDPVDGLPSGQLYMVLAMRDSGRDLEKAAVPGFEQARSILAQVAFTLAVAEEALEFEHRDLHWGNVLVRPAEAATVPFRLRGVDVQVEAHGMEVSLIDFTASRLRTMNGALAYCDLSLDPELFQGPKGHVQFDTYRWMRKLNGDDWAASCLATNCLWVAYLAEILATEKGSTLSTAQKRRLREFRKRAVQAPCCSQLVLEDELFKGLWVTA